MIVTPRWLAAPRADRRRTSVGTQIGLVGADDGSRRSQRSHSEGHGQAGPADVLSSGHEHEKDMAGSTLAKGPVEVEAWRARKRILRAGPKAAGGRPKRTPCGASVWPACCASCGRCARACPRRDSLLLRLGAARKGAGRAFGFVKIRMPPAGQAVANVSEEEQRSFDSTRRKLHRFLRRLPALRAIYPQGLVI